MKLLGKNLLWSFCRKNLLLIGIFILALFFRTYQLNNIPNGFYEEEVTNAYVGKYILLNGKDLFGNILPLAYFNKFDDYPPVIPMYLSGITSIIFGNTEFGARFATSLIGALSIIPLYLLLQFIFHDRRSTLFGAFLLSILPWHVVLSRTSAEGIIGFFFYCVGLLGIVHCIENPTKKWSFLALFSFILSYFLYPSLRILIPLVLAVPLMISYGIHRKFPKALVFIFIICSLLTIGIASTIWGKARFYQTSLFTNADMANTVLHNNESLYAGEGQNKIFQAKFFHNKVTGYMRQSMKQYFSYFSPMYLFFESGGQYRYYHVQDQGLLYVFMIPLFLFTLLPTVSHVKRRSIMFMLIVFMLSPIPAALTVDDTPHVHRSLFMILPIIFFASYGFLNMITIVRKKTILMVFVAVVILSEIGYFLHSYAVHADTNQSVLRNGGDKEMIRFVLTHESEYESIYIPAFERLPIYYLYFSNTYNRNLIGKFKSGLQIDEVGKIMFYSDWCPTKFIKPESITKKTLFIDSAICPKSIIYKNILTIIRKDATQAYYLYESK